MIKLTALCLKSTTVLAIVAAFSNLSFAQSDNLPDENNALTIETSVLESEIQEPEKPPEPAEFPAIESDAIQATLDESPTEESSELEILTRGQLHEAFATAHQLDPAPSPVVSEKPPEAIEELPPEYKPDGENVEWIPGYWAWNDEESEFIWISGIWRDVPQAKNWVPGYWSEIEDGYRWVVGYWIQEQVERIEFLPEPPANLDQGPSYLAPTDNHFYVPGCWIYQQHHYVWKPGFWNVAVPNRIWVPARYVWTPSGCIYCPGYWDYEFDQRGTCFGLVRFHSPIYLQTGYHYTPTCSINIGIDFLPHLFVREKCSSYFFGDWYGGGHVHHHHYRPWCELASHHRRYDPLLTYYLCSRSRYQNQHLVNWVRHRHSFYAHNSSHRPQHKFDRHGDNHRSTRISLGSNYANVVLHSHNKVGGRSELVKNSRNHVRHKSSFKHVDRVETNANIKKIHELQKQRKDRERLAHSKLDSAKLKKQLADSNERKKPRHSFKGQNRSVSGQSSIGEKRGKFDTASEFRNRHNANVEIDRHKSADKRKSQVAQQFRQKQKEQLSRSTGKAKSSRDIASDYFRKSNQATKQIVRSKGSKTSGDVARELAKHNTRDAQSRKPASTTELRRQQQQNVLKAQSQNQQRIQSQQQHRQRNMQQQQRDQQTKQLRQAENARKAAEAKRRIESNRQNAEKLRQARKSQLGASNQQAMQQRLRDQQRGQQDAAAKAAQSRQATNARRQQQAKQVARRAQQDAAAKAAQSRQATNARRQQQAKQVARRAQQDAAAKAAQSRQAANARRQQQQAKQVARQAQLKAQQQARIKKK